MKCSALLLLEHNKTAFNRELRTGIEKVFVIKMRDSGSKRPAVLSSCLLATKSFGCLKTGVSKLRPTEAFSQLQKKFTARKAKFVTASGGDDLLYLEITSFFGKINTFSNVDDRWCLPTLS